MNTGPSSLAEGSDRSSGTGRNKWQLLLGVIWQNMTATRFSYYINNRQWGHICSSSVFFYFFNSFIWAIWIQASVSQATHDSRVEMIRLWPLEVIKMHKVKTYRPYIQFFNFTDVLSIICKYNITFLVALCWSSPTLNVSLSHCCLPSMPDG